MTTNLISHEIKNEMEINFLGGLILEPDSYMAICNIINPESFFVKKNQLVYKTVVKLIHDREPVNYITIQENLLDEISRGEISPEYITALTDNAAIQSHMVYFANSINESYISRKLNNIYSIAKKDIDNNIDPFSVWQSVNERSAKLFSEEEKDYCIHDLIQSLETNNISDWGRLWGLSSLDNFVGPLPREAVTIIAGRPGHCKTSFVSTLMDYWAMQGDKIFFQSMEMSRREIDLRRLARFSRIPLWQIKQGTYSTKNQEIKNYREIINCAASKIFDLNKNVFVSDKTGLTPSEIALNIRINYEKHGINIFVLDNFHRINYSNNHDHRYAMEAALETIISECKNNGVMPVLLAQLNRGIENRESDNEPRLADLRECGRLEEAATNILMMYWKYKKTQAQEDKGTIKILNAKSRDGQTGRIFLKYLPEIYTFLDEEVVQDEKRETNKKRV